MKKIIAVFLAVMLIIAATPVYAISVSGASYSDGVLYYTVNTDDITEVYISGPVSSHWAIDVGGSLSKAINLQDGKYTLTVSSLEGTKSTSFTVGAVVEPTPVVTPDPTPVVTPEVTPDPTPVVTPEVTPDPTPVVTPEVTPDPTPVVTPEITTEPTPVATEEPDGELAISAYYANGAVVYTVSHVKDVSEIYIDGVSTGRAVAKSGTYSITMSLSAGSHTIRVDNLSGTASASFNVSLLKISAEYADGKLQVTLDNVSEPTEIWVDGKATFKATSKNGTITITMELAEGTHTVNASSASQNASTTVAVHNHVVEILAAKAPTCTETGLTEGANCSVCGNVLKAQEVIAALGHTIVADAGKDATCTEDGYTDGEHCSVCGEIIKAQEAVVADGHKTVVDAAKAATCIEAGLTEGEHCSICGEVLKAQETVAALGHTEEAIPAVDATCTENGLTEGAQCTVCGEIIKAQETVAALGHDVVTDDAVAPTCTEVGLTAGAYCSVCGEVFIAQVEIPVLPHEADNWTYAQNDEHELNCTICDKLVGTAPCDNPAVCPVCGYIADAAAAGAIYSVDLSALTADTLELVETAKVLPVDFKLDAMTAVRALKVNDDTSIMTVCFYNAGLCVKPEGKVTVTVPAELVEGYTLTAIVESVVDGAVTYIESAVEVTVNGNNATFELDYTGANACYVRLAK